MQTSPSLPEQSQKSDMCRRSIRRWEKGQTGFEIQTRDKTGPEEIVERQEWSLKETVNHDIISKIFLTVRLSVAVFSTKFRINKIRIGELRSPYNVDLAKVASCNSEKT